MYPSFEELTAACGVYQRIPVCKELYADRYAG